MNEPGDYKRVTRRTILLAPVDDPAWVAPREASNVCGPWRPEMRKLPPVHEELWSAVDRYIEDHMLEQDPVLEAALAASDAAQLPPIAVTPSQGKLLHLLVRMHGARSVLELGTLGGYSTIWMARALPPGGRLVTLELDERYADVARANLARAGLSDVVDLRVGPALETLAELHAAGEGPFDFIFIDADKGNNPGYLEWSLRLARPGSAILTDNVVRSGAILDPEGDDPTVGSTGVRGIRRFYDMLADEPRVSATAIQTVGAKGHDGFVLGIVEDGRTSDPSPASAKTSSRV
jgi:predicted O-methyltransferase YrrM